jgi:hypothetical protein
MNIIKAIDIQKNDKLSQVSDPIEAQKNTIKYLGKNKVLYKSNKPNKKYMILDMANHKWVHFGDIEYEDFTKHKDQERRKRYLSRAKNIKGDWKDNKYSSNNLSINILW